MPNQCPGQHFWKKKTTELRGLEGAKAEWETNRAQERQGGRNNYTWAGLKLGKEESRE